MVMCNENSKNLAVFVLWNIQSESFDKISKKNPLVFPYKGVT